MSLLRRMQNNPNRPRKDDKQAKTTSNAPKSPKQDEDIRSLLGLTAESPQRQEDVRPQESTLQGMVFEEGEVEASVEELARQRRNELRDWILDQLMVSLEHITLSNILPWKTPPKCDASSRNGSRNSIAMAMCRSPSRNKNSSTRKSWTNCWGLGQSWAVSGLHRKERQTHRNRRQVPQRRPCAADYRSHRAPTRTSYRPPLADGRRSSARWKPCQRDHSTLCD